MLKLPLSKGEATASTKRTSTAHSQSESRGVGSSAVAGSTAGGTVTIVPNATSASLSARLSKSRNSRSNSSTLEAANAAVVARTAPQLKNEKEVLLSNNHDFANPLYLDDDDINLYLVAEMLREKKRKTASGLQYREPYEIPSGNNSPKSSSADSRKNGIAASVASSSAGSSAAASRSSYPGIPTHQLAQLSSAVAASGASSPGGSCASGTPTHLQKPKSGSHHTHSQRGSQSNSHSHHIHLHTGHAHAKPSDYRSSNQSHLTSSMASTASVSPPASVSAQRKKRVRSTSRERSQTLSDLASKLQQQKIHSGSSTPSVMQVHSITQSPTMQHRMLNSQSQSISSLAALNNSVRAGLEAVVAKAALPAASESKDVDMGSDNSEEIEIHFHEDSATPDDSELMQAADVTPLESMLTAKASPHIPAPVTPSGFQSVLRTQLGLATVLSFLDIRSLSTCMQISTQFRDDVLSTEPRGKIIWAKSKWKVGSGEEKSNTGMPGQIVRQNVDHFNSRSVTSSSIPIINRKSAGNVFLRINQTYGVQQAHNNWIIAPNPPHSFLLSRLIHLDLSLDEDESASNMFALTDAHFVLLPYFTSLISLNMSRVGQKPHVAASARLTAISLARVALLPNLQALYLDDCLEWLDDLGLACFRNKEHARLLLSNVNASASTTGITMPLPPGAPFQFLSADQSLPSLRTLSLANCPKITSRGLEYLISNNGLPQLTCLNLSGCTNALQATSVAALEANTPRMRRLNLTGCGNYDASQAFHQLLKIRSLTELELGGWADLTDEHLEACGSNSLVTLVLRDCSSLSSRGLQALCNFTTLRSIDLSNVRSVSDSTLALFGARLFNLQSITIWNATAVTDKGIEGLLFGGVTVERFIESQQIQIRSGRQQQLVAKVSTVFFPALVYSLTAIQISGSRLFDRSCALLAACTKLTTLQLTDLAAISDQGVAALCSSTSSFNGLSIGYLKDTLNTLQVARFGLGLTSASGAHFSKLTHLSDLDLSGNDRIDDSTVNVLLPALKKLRRLVLCHCSLITDRTILLLNQFVLSQSKLPASYDSSFEVDVRYCIHLSLGNLQSFIRSHPKTVRVLENLAEWNAATVAVQQQQARAQFAAPMYPNGQQNFQFSFNHGAQPQSPLQQMQQQQQYPMQPQMHQHQPQPQQPMYVQNPYPPTQSPQPVVLAHPHIPHSLHHNPHAPQMHTQVHQANSPISPIVQPSQGPQHIVPQMLTPPTSTDESSSLPMVYEHPPGVLILPGSNGRSHRTEEHTSSDMDGFRIEDQVVANEDEEFEEEEEDDEEDEDEEESDQSMVVNHKFKDAVEQDEQGEKWDVHE